MFEWQNCTAEEWEEVEVEGRKGLGIAGYRRIVALQWDVPTRQDTSTAGHTRPTDKNKKKKKNHRQPPTDASKQPATRDSPR